MKCQHVHPWLFTVKARTALPDAVREHLDHCPNCRQQWQHLERLDDRFCRMTVPPPNPAVKEQLWLRLDQTPRPAKRSPLPKRRLARFVLGWAAAASLLIGLGWVLGRQTAS